MKKIRNIPDTHLSLEAIKELDTHLIGPGGIFDEYHAWNFAIIEPNGDQWSFDNSETFLADYHPSFGSYYERTRPHFAVTVVNHLHHPGQPSCSVTVMAPDKKTIESIFAIIEKHREPLATVTSLPRGWKLHCRRPVKRRAKHQSHQPIA